MTGLREFEPHELRAPGIDIALAVQELTAISSRAGAVDAEPRPEVAKKVTLSVQRLLDGVSKMRHEIWRIAKDLAQEAETVGGTVAIHTALQHFGSVRDTIHDTEWEIWRRKHGFDDDSAEKVPISSQVDGRTGAGTIDA
jgi:hypothetical protein